MTLPNSALISGNVEMMGTAADIYHWADSGNECQAENCPGAHICPHAEALDLLALRAVVAAVETHIGHVVAEMIRDLRTGP